MYLSYEFICRKAVILLGPLSHMSGLDVMWVSFYCMAFMMISILIIYLVRHKIKSVILSFVLKFIAYALFALGSFLMVLVVATWPA